MPETTTSVLPSRPISRPVSEALLNEKVTIGPDFHIYGTRLIFWSGTAVYPTSPSSRLSASDSASSFRFSCSSEEHGPRGWEWVSVPAGRTRSATGV